MTTAESIRQYIEQAFPGVLEGQDGDGPAVAESDLLDLLDSLQLLRLVVDVEQRFGIKVENRDMTPENLGSIAKMAAYVDSRRR